MQGHIHLSVISVATIMGVVVLTTFFLHMASIRLLASDDPSTQAWGKAIAVGWG